MILFRRRLVLDTDPMEVARVKLILQKNGIRFEEKTTVGENAMARSFNAAAAVQVRGGYSDVSVQTYVYRLFVPARDFARAKALAYGNGAK